jgi:hypothetical protein
MIWKDENTCGSSELVGPGRTWVRRVDLVEGRYPKWFDSVFSADPLGFSFKPNWWFLYFSVWQLLLHSTWHLGTQHSYLHAVCHLFPPPGGLCELIPLRPVSLHFCFEARRDLHALQHRSRRPLVFTRCNVHIPCTSHQLHSQAYSFLQ